MFLMHIPSVSAVNGYVGRRPKTPVIRLFMQYERGALEQNIILVSKIKQVATYGRK
jgi:hypothetical protein